MVFNAVIAMDYAGKIRQCGSALVYPAPPIATTTAYLPVCPAVCYLPGILTPPVANAHLPITTTSCLRLALLCLMPGGEGSTTGRVSSDR